MKVQLIASPLKIAPPSFSAVLSVNVQLFALPWYIAPPLSALFSANVQSVASHLYIAPP